MQVPFCSFFFHFGFLNFLEFFFFSSYQIVILILSSDHQVQFLVQNELGEVKQSKQTQYKFFFCLTKVDKKFPDKLYTIHLASDFDFFFSYFFVFGQVHIVKYNLHFFVSSQLPKVGFFFTKVGQVRRVGEKFRKIEYIFS